MFSYFDVGLCVAWVGGPAPVTSHCLHPFSCTVVLHFVSTRWITPHWWTTSWFVPKSIAIAMLIKSRSWVLSGQYTFRIMAVWVLCPPPPWFTRQIIVRFLVYLLISIFGTV